MQAETDLEKAIKNRRSNPKLVAPAPDAAVVERLIEAAITAPDHGRIKPWRFIVIEGEGLAALGDLFVAAEAAQGQVSQQRMDTLRQQPLRAPMMVTVVARIEPEHPIPAVERRVAVGCAVQNFLLAAEAAGFGAYWRTGPMAYNETVKQGLGLVVHEEILAFVYVGTSAGSAANRPVQSVADVTQRWNGAMTTPWE